MVSAMTTVVEALDVTSITLVLLMLGSATVLLHWMCSATRGRHGGVWRVRARLYAAGTLFTAGAVGIWFLAADADLTGWLEWLPYMVLVASGGVAIGEIFLRGARHDPNLD